MCFLKEKHRPTVLLRSEKTRVWDKGNLMFLDNQCLLSVFRTKISLRCSDTEFLFFKVPNLHGRKSIKVALTKTRLKALKPTSVLVKVTSDDRTMRGRNLWFAQGHLMCTLLLNIWCAAYHKINDFYLGVPKEATISLLLGLFLFSLSK